MEPAEAPNKPWDADRAFKYFHTQLLPYDSVVSWVRWQQAQTSNGPLQAAIQPVASYLQQTSTVGTEVEVKGGEDPAALNIILIRGAPSPMAVQQLAVRYGFSPELVFEHMNLPGTYRILSPPSPTWPCLTLRIVSVGSWDPKKAGKHDQGWMDEVTDKHKAQVLKRSQFGSEQCRKVSLHGPDFFSVEQEVTFMVYRPSAADGPPWTGIIMADCSSSASQSAPWRVNRAPCGFLPLARHGHCPLRDADLGEGWGLDRPLDPFASRAANDDKRLTPHQKDVAARHPFVLVFDLLNTFVLSWHTLFCLLRELHHDLPAGADKAAVLQNSKLVLDRATHYIRSMVVFVKARRSVGWLNPVSQAARSDEEAIDGLAAQVLDDLETLLLDAQIVSQHTSDILQTEMNGISISEAKKSVNQADRVGRLTQLGYIFLPLSFMSSCFGMNLNIFDDPKPDLRSFFIVAIPFTVVCILFLLAMDFAGLMKRYALAAARGFRK